jgi:hypothetical protein
MILYSLNAIFHDLFFPDAIQSRPVSLLIGNVGFLGGGGGGVTSHCNITISRPWRRAVWPLVDLSVLWSKAWTIVSLQCPDFELKQFLRVLRLIDGILWL